MILRCVTAKKSGSQWPRCLRRGSTAARLLGLWVRIPPVAWVSVCIECCVLSGRGLCDELITRPEKFYRLWCVVACDLETSRMRRPWPALGRSATGGKRRRRRRAKTSSTLVHKLEIAYTFWLFRTMLTCYLERKHHVSWNSLSCLLSRRSSRLFGTKEKMYPWGASSPLCWCNNKGVLCIIHTVEHNCTY